VKLMSSSGSASGKWFIFDPLLPLSLPTILWKIGRVVALDFGFGWPNAKQFTTRFPPVGVLDAFHPHTKAKHSKVALNIPQAFHLLRACGIRSECDCVFAQFRTPPDRLGSEKISVRPRCLELCREYLFMHGPHGALDRRTLRWLTDAFFLLYPRHSKLDVDGLRVWLRSDTANPKPKRSSHGATDYDI
jgi:hypothetical protein